MPAVADLAIVSNATNEANAYEVFRTLANPCHSVNGAWPLIREHCIKT